MPDSPKVISIDGVDYIRKGLVELAEKVDGLEYCIIRTYSAGVHVGYVKNHEGITAELINSRRMWNWKEKAAELNQMAMEGCKSDKFSMAVPKITVVGVIEVIPCSEKAKNYLQAIKEWKC